MLVDVHVVDIGLYLMEQLAAELERVPREHDEIHRHVVFHQKRRDRLHRRLHRLRLRIAVRAGGNQRKRDGLAPVRLRQRQRISIAGGKLCAFPVRSAPPDGADGVNHVSARKAIAARQLRFAGSAAAQRPAFRQKLRPGGAMNRSVHAAPAQQSRIRGVHNRVHGHFRKVVADDFKRHSPSSLRYRVSAAIASSSVAAKNTSRPRLLSRMKSFSGLLV